MPRRSLKRLARDRRGTVAVILAFAMAAIIAMAALGVEAALWFATRRSLQNAADAGAISAALEIKAGQTDWSSAATVDANRTLASTTGVTVTPHNPPTSGAYTSDHNAVEVTVSLSQTLLLGGIFQTWGGADPITISARSVATQVTSGGGNYCVLGLDTSAADTIHLNNNATLPNAACGAASNSTSNSGLSLSNNASISGPVAVAAGSYSLSNNAAISGAVSRNTTTPDPYAGVSVPAPPSTCTNQTSSGTNNVTVNLTPGRFCSGLSFSNNAVVNMAAGTYYIDTQFSFSNNAVMNATGGVTIVFTSNYAINVGNNGIMNITAPTSGTLAGLAMVGPRDGTSNTRQVFSNNTTLNVKGAIYFPSQSVELDNNASTSSNGCAQLIADKVSFSNNANLPSNCSGAGTTPIGQTNSVKLVE